MIQPETNIWVAANLQGLHRALTGIVETLLRSTRETRFQVVWRWGTRMWMCILPCPEPV